MYQKIAPPPPRIVQKITPNFMYKKLLNTPQNSPYLSQKLPYKHPASRKITIFCQKNAARQLKNFWHFLEIP